MITNTQLFKTVEENIKPKAEEKLVCDGCPNALAFALKDEVRFYCKIMHTITWTSTERTTIVVCTDNIAPLENPVAPQQAPSHQEATLEEFPDFQEFNPYTKPFIHSS